MKIIEARHMPHQQKQDEAARNTQGESRHIDKGAPLLAKEISEGGDQVVS
jgi:hypothetical protein